MAIGRIPGYDYYNETNIDQLWDNLDQYKILLIDEDCMFDWDNPGPDYNKPTPVLPIGVSFYNHKTELKNWIFNGGRLFSTDQNDISPDYLHNVWWTWLPDELQVESNEYPSDYPETVKLLNDSFVVCSEPYPIYCQRFELMKYYAEAFQKVFDNIEEVVGAE